MKQLRIFLLLLLFLQSKIGLAFNVHYCGNHIAKISWAFDAKGCGMEKKALPADALEFSQKSCCNDDVVIAQNDTDQNLSDEAKNKLQQSIVVFQPLVVLPALNAPIALQLGYRPPPPKEQLYTHFCAPLFYE